MKHPRGCVCFKDSRTRTQHYLPQLRLIARQRKANKRDVIEASKPCVIKFIGQCCHALLKKYIQLPSENYNKLKKYRDDILYIASAKTNLRQKRARLIEKRGGFLPFLIPALTSSLVSIGSQLISQLI
jgi:hypothetical protein